MKKILALLGLLAPLVCFGQGPILRQSYTTNSEAAARLVTTNIVNAIVGNRYITNINGAGTNTSLYYSGAHSLFTDEGNALNILSYDPLGYGGSDELIYTDARILARGYVGEGTLITNLTHAPVVYAGDGSVVVFTNTVAATGQKVYSVIATGTNSATVTNVTLRAGANVTVTTNSTTDWTVSAPASIASQDGKGTNTIVYPSAAQSLVVDPGNGFNILSYDPNGYGGSEEWISTDGYVNARGYVGSGLLLTNIQGNNIATGTISNSQIAAVTIASNRLAFAVATPTQVLDATNAASIRAITAQQTNQASILALTAQQTNATQIRVLTAQQTNQTAILALTSQQTNATQIRLLTAPQTNYSTLISMLGPLTNGLGGGSVTITNWNGAAGRVTGGGSSYGIGTNASVASQSPWTDNINGSNYILFNLASAVGRDDANGGTVDLQSFDADSSITLYNATTAPGSIGILYDSDKHTFTGCVIFADGVSGNSTFSNDVTVLGALTTPSLVADAVTVTNVGGSGSFLALSNNVMVLTNPPAGGSAVGLLLSVFDTGATGDGTTDDSAAIQSALNQTTNGVYFPAGHYKINTTLTNSGYVKIEGAGVQKTFIEAGTAGMNMWQLGSASADLDDGIIRDLYLDGNGIAKNGFVIGQATGYHPAIVELNNIRVSYCTNAGFMIYASQKTELSHVRSSYNYFGLLSQTNTGSTAHSTTLRVFTSEFNANTNAGVRLDYSHTFSFDSCIMQGNAGPAMFVNGTDPTLYTHQYLKIRQLYEEANNSSSTYSNLAAIVFLGNETRPIHDVTISDSFMQRPGSYGLVPTHIYFGPGRYLLTGNSFSDPEIGGLACSNSSLVEIYGQSVGRNYGMTSDNSPNEAFTNALPVLGSLPNIYWDYFGSRSQSEKSISPKAHSRWVNGGSGGLIQASATIGSTSGAGAITTTYGGVKLPDLTGSGSFAGIDASGNLFKTNAPAGVAGGNPTASSGVLFGDSVTYGLDPYLLLNSDTNMGTTLTNKAVIGRTLEQIKADVEADTQLIGYDWISLMGGLNNVGSDNAATLLSKFQLIVNSINAGKKDSAIVIVHAMTPCRLSLIGLLGTTNGQIAYTNWLDFNTGVMGGGPTPITNVTYRSRLVSDGLADPDGNLAPLYAVDGTHFNATGKTLYARVLRQLLNQAGFLTVELSANTYVNQGWGNYASNSIAALSSKVGIGTTTPLQPLSFGSSLYTSSNKFALYENNANGDMLGFGIQNSPAGGAGLDLVSSAYGTNKRASFRANGTWINGALITGAGYENVAGPTGGAIFQGNVGINITNPSAKLTLHGPTYAENLLNFRVYDASFDNYQMTFRSDAGYGGLIAWMWDEKYGGTTYPNVLAFQSGKVMSVAPWFITNNITVSGLAYVSNGVSAPSGSMTATNFVWSNWRWTDVLATAFTFGAGPNAPAALQVNPNDAEISGLGYGHGDDARFSIQSVHSLAETNAANPNFYFEPHLHLMSTTHASGTNSTWRLKLDVARVYGSYTNTSVIALTNTCRHTNVYSHQILSFGNVTNNALSGGSSVIFRGFIERIDGGAGDIGNSQTVALDSLDIHVPVNQFGTSGQYSN